MRVYYKEEVPLGLHYRQSERIGNMNIRFFCHSKIV